MSPVQSLLAFTATASILTITPGLDTALILRTSTVEGARRAISAGGGILLGCLIWGAAASFGAAGLLAASTLAFTTLKWVGAGYLVWAGLKLIWTPRRSFDPGAATAIASTSGAAWFRRGMLTNLLNPKVGVFYISFLPQFVPDGVAAAGWMLMLALIHCALGAFWFAALIAAGRPLGNLLRKPAVLRALDRVTGGVFLAFGIKLALDDN